MISSKVFCGEEVIDVTELSKKNKNKFIKLEYYEIQQTEDGSLKNYGIEIVKNECKNNKTKKEVAYVENITENEKTINEIMDIIKRNKVTPITLEYIIHDIIESKITD